jgi:hypothetical protein
VRHDDARSDLQKQDGNDDEEVFADLTLALGQWSTGSIGASSGWFSPNSYMKSTRPKARKVKQKLAQVQTKVLVVGVLPTSGS